mmetsp:Transcript_28598/g.57214  ORF Transcript_28598/g.57214 Transcript_28598/m.57214 type:complete len:224 (-) Transcript_28598:12-683(-)
MAPRAMTGIWIPPLAENRFLIFALRVASVSTCGVSSPTESAFSSSTAFSLSVFSRVGALVPGRGGGGPRATPLGGGGPLGGPLGAPMGGPRGGPLGAAGEPLGGAGAPLAMAACLALASIALGTAGGAFFVASGGGGVAGGPPELEVRTIGGRTLPRLEEDTSFSTADFVASTLGTALGLVDPISEMRLSNSLVMDISRPEGGAGGGPLIARGGGIYAVDNLR